VPPLVCIPGIAGTADVYYKQIMSLCMKVHALGVEFFSPTHIYSDFYYLKFESSCVAFICWGAGYLQIIPYHALEGVQIV
jgi:hypothetical protein